MGREIERKFLVRDESWRTAVCRSARLRQAYLTEGGRASVRVRIADTHATINIKSARLGVSRDEYEYEIPLSDAEHLMTLCSGSENVLVTTSMARSCRVRSGIPSGDPLTTFSKVGL